MTLHEAIGVRVDTDIKTGEKLTHSEIYGRAIEFLGWTRWPGSFRSRWKPSARS